MLKGTSATYAKMRTAGHHSLRRRPQHFQQPCLVVPPVLTDALEAHRLARQRTRDESRLARADDPLSIVRQVNDFRRLALAPGSAPDRLPCAHAPLSHTCRNSAKCGSLPARSSAFTLSTSSAWRSRVSRPRISSKRKYTRYVLSTSVSQYRRIPIRFPSR